MTRLGKFLSSCLALFLLVACSITIDTASETAPEPASSLEVLNMETALAIAAATAEAPRPTPTFAPAGTFERGCHRQSMLASV